MLLGSFPVWAAELYARYRADAGLKIDSDNVITQWVDEAGSALDLDRVIGDPTILELGNSNSTATTIASFNGNSSIWAATDDWGSVGGDRTVVAYLRLKDAGDGYLFDGSTQGGMTRAHVLGNQWQVGIQPSPIENADNPDPVTAAATPGSWQAHIFEYDYRERGFLGWDKYYMVSHYINGSLIGSNEVDEEVDLSGFILAANVRGQESLNCDVAEVLVYDNLMDDSERTLILDELDARWGGLYDMPASYQSSTVIQSNRSVVPFGIHEIVTLKVDVKGSLNPFPINELTYNLDGTARLEDISEIRVYSSGNHHDFDPANATLLGQNNNPVLGTDSIAMNEQLLPGINHIHLAAVMADGADEGGVLDAEIESFQLGGSAAGSYLPSQTDPDGMLTLAGDFYMTAIRSQGDDGVDTYRIPGLATTTNGTIIAIFDIRNDSSGDLPGNIDVGIMRSTDGGVSWGPMQTIMDFDESASGASGNGVGDPAILVDRKTGRIWAAALWSFGNNGWSGSGPGLTPEETGQYVLCHSDDDGLTWSEPYSITEDVKNPDWNLFFQGPGKGFMTREGILIFPSQYKDSGGVPRSCFIWSEDHGETWQVSAPAIPSGIPQTTEAQMVELDSGDLLISMRNHDGRGERLWCLYSWDHGSESIAEGSWGPPWFTQRDPTCMASVELARSVHDGHPYEVLLFANPDNSSSRVDMTVRASFDGGQTWPYGQKIDDRPAAYVCMTMLPDGDVGILYETGDSHAYQTLTFARFPLEWVTGDSDGDSDGIPDHYEDATGLDKTDPDDAGDDDDDDGASNLEEYRARTNPQSAKSILSLSAKLEAGGMMLVFPSVPFLGYSIETSTDLRNWTILNGYGGITAKEAFTSVPAPTESLASYYRVRIAD